MKRFFFLLIAFCATVPLVAQYNYNAAFKEVDKLVGQGLYNQAYPKAEKILAQAEREHNSQQMLHATYVMNQTAQLYQEDATDSALARYQRLLPRLAPLDLAICNLFLAQFYDEYLNSHRWKIKQNADTDEPDLDYKLWPEKRYLAAIALYAQAALKETRQLQQTSVDYARYCCDTTSKKGLFTTPTLYDLVVQSIVKMNMGDSEVLHLWQSLLDFHQQDVSDDLRIWIELKMVNPNEQRLLTLLDQYRASTSPMVANIYASLARQLDNEERKVEAVAYCDTAVSRFPQSEGGVECYNLRQRILQPSVSVDIENEYLMPDRDLLAVVSVTNTDHLYYRIVKHPVGKSDLYNCNFVGLPVLKQWDQSLTHFDDHLRHKFFAYLPPMPAGDYDLLVSADPNFDKYGYYVSRFTICDAQLVTTISNGLDGLLVSRTTGAPIAHHKVEVINKQDSKTKLVATTTTDENGRFHFDPSIISQNFYGDMLRVKYQGTTLTQSCFRTNNLEATTDEVQLFLDRPIYRPGDTLHCSLLDYATDHRFVGNTLSGQKFSCILFDINNKSVDTLILTTDLMGTASGHFVLPANGLPGKYRIEVKEQFTNKYSNSISFTVEHYKQPKFLVTLPADNRTHRLGEEVRQQLNAVTYSGVPLSGARVSWSVTRVREIPWRWYFQPYGSIETVATGNGVTNEQGTYEIVFVPQPDTNNLASNNVYRFVVTAEVTDLNGETHSQSATMRIGQTNSYLVLMGEDELRDFSALRFQYRNLDGQSLEGQVRVTVERVQSPQRPLLRHSKFNEQVEHTLSQAEFESRYPLLAYHVSDLDSTSWQRKRVASYLVDASTQLESNPLNLPALGEGLYRIALSGVDAYGDTISTERYYTLMPAKAQHVTSQQLLWSDVDKTTAPVGEIVTLRVGSRFADVHTYCLVSTRDTTIQQQHLVQNDNIQEISIPITNLMLGGFDITILSVKENIVCRRSYHVEVPFTHKQLKVKFSTFRDKLIPGQLETWSIKVDKPSNLLLTMYDAALDTYAKLSWSLSPWRMRSRQDLMNWSRYWPDEWILQKELRYRDYKGVTPQGWSLSSAWSFYSGRVNRMARANGVKQTRAMNDIVVTELAIVEDEEIFAVVDELGTARGEEGMVMASKAAPMATQSTADAAEAQTTADSPGAEVNIRENLSTLGFFFPNLRTDSDGSATFSFTAPEALSQWNIQGLAWTRDLCVGRINAQTVTQKPLMVVPNAPRFLRWGDTVQLVVKVSNLTDSVLSTKVRLQLSDAEILKQVRDADGNFFDQTIVVEVGAHANVPVTFRFVVPKDIYVATYRVVAQSEAFSDGEQAPLLVLSNRELVTESMSMYINGVGEKTCRLQHLLDCQKMKDEGLQSTLEHHGATIEFTSNPIWYAIQSLPYIADREDPSNIYRANALYANSLSQHIVASNPLIVQCLNRPDSTRRNPNFLNQHSSLTQTLMEETPWLQEAPNEQEQWRRLSQYFDNEALRQQLDRNRDLLIKAQMGNGGWSWIPGGRYASEYITQYILKLNGQLERLAGQSLLPQKNLNQALYYVDRETYDYYQKWVKKYKDCNVANIDYLYTRSFYPKAIFMGLTVQAYNYYYTTALKNRNQYRDLSTQAKLALIFHRHGDTKAAQEMVGKLKGSALYSDEMGMYWRDNVSGYYWQQRPIEVQSLLIQVFDEVLHDHESVALMQQWLLKQKQTTRWNSDVATANAVSALMKTGSSEHSIHIDTANSVSLTIGGENLQSDAERCTGYQQHSWGASEVTPTMGEVIVRKSTSGIAWGAFYWQYFEDLDKIPYSEMGIKMQKTMYIVASDGTLAAIQSADSQRQQPNAELLKVGSRVRVRILIDCDRNLEYLELRDGRASCMEPVSTASGWHYSWRDGLGYYLVVGNASHSLFIDRLEKGKYVVEYDCYVTQSGTFTTGTTRIQCHYAPEFRSLLGATKLCVSE